MTLREASKASWNAGNPASIEQLNCGSFQRIADALEAMAEPFLGLLRDVEYYKKRAEEDRECAKRACRSNAALRACLRKVKEKVK